MAIQKHKSLLTGEIMYIQIPDEKALQELYPLAEKYGWLGRGPFTISRPVIYPCYIYVNDVTMAFISWQDNFPNLDYTYLEDNYHNGVPYTALLELENPTPIFW